jgi:hypothetical protein
MQEATMSKPIRLEVRIAVVLTLATAAGFFSPAPARADGAVALGIPVDMTADGFSYGYRVNAPNRDQARDTAFEQCCSNKVAPESARKLCVLVADFRNECLAIAMDPKDGTPGYGVAIAADRSTAEARALGFCRATAGRDRREFCKIDAVACDGSRN